MQENLEREPVVPDGSTAQDCRAALAQLGDRVLQAKTPGDVAYAAAEIVGRTLGVSRVGYGTIDPVLETITIERDWSATGISTLAGTLHFRDYGSYIDDLKRGETVVIADAYRDPRTADRANALDALSAVAVVNMPITEQDGFVALLYLANAQAREWSADELEFIRDVARRTRMSVERRRAEQALADLAASLERQVKLRTGERDRMWRLSHNLMMVVNEDTEILSVNPTWLNTLGWTESEVIGHSFQDFLHPDDLEPSKAQNQNLVRGETMHRFDNRYRRRDGSYCWISWHAVPSEGLIHGVGRDITEERENARTLAQAQEQLRQSQKMEAIGKLTGGVAHDFNNLLQVIGGNLQLLGADLAGNAQGQRRVANAMSGVSRGAKLAAQLLAFARHQPLAPKVINVARLIRDMDDLLRHTLGEPVEVETVVAGGLWNALADAVNVENALLNLAINARDAMEGRGRLTIEAGNASLDQGYCETAPDVTPGQYVMIAVTDTGSGMSAEVAERAFEPFFTTKGDGRGTGLGLSMVYGFVKQSGGHIRIYSEPGEGTTMRIYLPRALEAEEAATPVDAGPVRGGSEIVLVAEDDEAVRDTVVAMLDELGYEVLQASDAQGAQTIIEGGVSVDLLFTDVVMPGPMKSTELARRARARLPQLAVLFTSGYTENAIVHGGRLDTGVELLAKPYTREALARRLRQVLDARAAAKPAAGTEARASEAGPAPAAPVNHATGATAQSLRILLCEDEWLIRSSLAEMLASRGHSVVETGDASQALAAFDAQAIDLLLTDVGLPGQSGVDLARALRQRLPQLPVLFATAHGPSRDFPTDARTGYVGKPYGADELVQAVARVTASTIA